VDTFTAERYSPLIFYVIIIIIIIIIILNIHVIYFIKSIERLTPGWRQCGERLLPSFV
jgi:hypothetical protein